MLRHLAMLFALAAFVPDPARAGTLGLRVDVEFDGPLSDDIVEAVAWHAATRATCGASPVAADACTADVPVMVDRVDGGALRDASPGDVARALHARGITTFVDVSVRWHAQVREIGTPDGGTRFDFLPDPRVEAVQYRVHPDRLAEEARHSGRGGDALVAVAGRAGAHAVVPEVALRRALAEALDPIAVPRWGTRLVAARLPVVLAVDAAWKARHGAAWAREARLRVAVASALLGEAGLALDVVAHVSWDAPVDLPDLAARLHHLHAADLGVAVPPGALRIGLTGVSTPSEPGRPEQVGRAFEPGRDLVVADQRHAFDLGAPHESARWDRADEAVAMAHEILHALGVPHDDSPSTLMSARHDGLTWRVSPRGAALAQAAAQARVAHWDSVAALTALAHAASVWLPHAPSRQVDYVVGNLTQAPPVGAFAPGVAAPLVDAALSRLYLDLSRDPGAAGESDSHRSAAILHADAVQRRDPVLARALSPGVVALVTVPVDEIQILP